MEKLTLQNVCTFCLVGKALLQRKKNTQNLLNPLLQPAKCLRVLPGQESFTAIKKLKRKHQIY